MAPADPQGRGVTWPFANARELGRLLLAVDHVNRPPH